MGRSFPSVIFFDQGHFHEDIAAPAPVLFARGRNRPAQFPAGSGADGSVARGMDTAVLRESNGYRRSDLHRVVPDEKLDRSGCPNHGGGSASEERAAARSFLRHESAA